MIGNKIAEKITTFSRTLPQNSLETVKKDKEISEERFIYRFIYIYIYIYIYIRKAENYWWSEINIMVW